MVQGEELVSLEQTELKCIGVDSKVDANTLGYEELEVQGKMLMKKCRSPEHLTFTSESGQYSGRYLTHMVIPRQGSTGSLLQAVLVDNTAVNTGVNNGFVVHLEKLVGRGLHTIGCGLHQNELPMRALFRLLDGGTSGPCNFNGILGGKLSGDIHLRPVARFKAITSDIAGQTHDFAEMVDLTDDQKLLYHYALGISLGRLGTDLSILKLGPLCHARWLSLAVRVMCLYTREEKPSEPLVLLVKYITSVYVPSWFSIKKSKFHQMPKILFTMIRKTCHLPLNIKEVLWKNLSGNSFCLIPQNFIYCLLMDDDSGIRALGVDAILKCRKSRKTSNPKRIPDINFQAATWTELISLESVSIEDEPPSTRKFDVNDFQALDTHRTLPVFPCHSQSVERSVKLVSDTCQTVYGLERRHQLLKVKTLGYSTQPAIRTKEECINVFHRPNIGVENTF